MSEPWRGWMLDSHVVAEIRVLEARVKDATDGANGLADALAAALERCRVLEAIVVKEAQAREKAEAALAAFVDYFDTWDVSPPQLTRLLNELRAAGRESGEASRNEGPESAVGPEGSRRQAAAKSAARCPCGYGEPHERECGM